MDSKNIWEGGPLAVGYWVYMKDRYRSGAAYTLYEITGETSRSWIVGTYTKVPKSTAASVLYTTQKIKEQQWTTDHAWRIADRVKSLDYTTLQQIAAIIGYDAKRSE